ncbi:MAG: GH3 auxin-responsive promoter family protein, partial [Flavobacteriaceae bacterium]|nr:GH3 auxin-responsive promoter family protein [Flavobacteriaceae bacterium]
ARAGQFHDWLAGKDKLGVQHKIPRLSNSRQYLEELMAL